MLLTNIITAAALGLAGLAAAKPAPVGSSTGQPCGLKTAPCPEDARCIPDSKDCTNLKRCRGTCHFKNYYQQCGGFRVSPSPPCPGRTKCKDDPRLPDSCGMACDAPGICISPKLPQCGGFAGFTCPYGLYCYDAPNDGCDPNDGGADCIGVCL
ncbi:hypothetical protein AK830_g11957 [Neonectria ditissima]|uniref:Kazal-like domain-containing protein n=1 Tax=Neonectria ditissima TaxID=78410 RepID=A0A0P7AQC1_9HYPO|nr:hypothetical protein AK830_g11957 [Neonectria ditissima]